MTKKNYAEMAKNILHLVGEKDNVVFATHCLTRLRITVRDKSLVKEKELGDVQGVLGLQWNGEQLHIIVGQEVENLYREFCKTAGIEENARVEEKLDKDKLTFKGFINKLLDAVAACIAPLQPVLIFAGVVKMIPTVLGPSVLNLLPETSDFIRILNIAGDAGFYFFPMYLAYSGSKKFGCNTMMALLIAGILLSPSLIEIMNSGEEFTIYGIPMTATSYSSSFLPMVLITYVMSYIEKFLKKIIPNSLKSILFPLVLVLIMLPLALCVLGPLGTWLGKLIAAGIVALHSVAGPLAIAIIAAFWSLIVATGMHQALIAIAVTYIAEIGYDDSILIGAIICFYAMQAIDLAYFIKAKNAEDRSTAGTALVTLSFGGISEPSIFGILLKNRKALINIIIGGFVGGLYAGIMQIHLYFPAAGNLFGALAFAGEKSGSFVNGIIASIIAAGVAFALSMIFGFEDKNRVS